MWLSMIGFRLSRSRMMIILFMMMMMITKMTIIMMQVGPGDDYLLTVGGFNHAESSLGDSMAYNNGMKFSTK